MIDVCDKEILNISVIADDNKKINILHKNIEVKLNNGLSFCANICRINDKYYLYTRGTYDIILAEIDKHIVDMIILKYCTLEDYLNSLNAEETEIIRKKFWDNIRLRDCMKINSVKNMYAINHEW